jgi:hypothetical protein
MSAPEPTYPLEDLQEAIRDGDYAITGTAFRGAAQLYLDEEDIRSCVGDLKSGDFYKTMPSNTVPGLMQDVYKCRYHGFALYLKLQRSHGGTTVVISFKQDEDA